tara:strand:- start:2923 stop:3264 length:342 start_codon:yes stop_codon:yes gene_type:complete
MNKFSLYLLFLILVPALAQAKIDITKCDNISNKTEKYTCLSKLKAKAISENAKDKLKPIDKKLKKAHKKLGNTVTKTEKGVISTIRENVDKLNQNKYIKKIKEKNKQMNEKAN